MNPKKIFSIYLKCASLFCCSAFSYLGVYLTLWVWSDMNVDKRAVWLVMDELVAVVMATVLLKNKYRYFICQHIKWIFLVQVIFSISSNYLLFIDPYYKVIAGVIDVGVFIGLMNTHTMEVREILFTKRKERIRFNIDIGRFMAAGFVIGATMATLIPVTTVTWYVILNVSFTLTDFVTGFIYYVFLEKYMRRYNLDYSGILEDCEDD